MTWADLIAAVIEKELVWFLGPIALGLVIIIGIWVYRVKRNGSGGGPQKLETRLEMVEKDVAVIKEGLKRVDHWIDQNEITRDRDTLERGEIRGRLQEILRQLNSTPADGNPRH